MFIKGRPEKLFSDLSSEMVTESQSPGGHMFYRGCGLCGSTACFHLRIYEYLLFTYTRQFIT